MILLADKTGERADAASAKVTAATAGDHLISGLYIVETAE